ncbi:porin family protein [Dyadobacter sp. LHD-138]|uniref:porin family protein n=1 Tax=Dyadobacter sp. LHD-138 TaxID=3071413 RepID=UPI0027DF7AAC|nr:porin family protein [Dyadobacter sp. LHD-138]MDQ6477096.1 porin family protein [Dyadobacter sp. LHD-138]
MKKLNVILLAILPFLTPEIKAQSDKKLNFNVRAGFSIGASTPIGIPVTIRKIESYNPGLLLSLEAGLHYPLPGKFGLATALRLEQKGMTTQSRVKGYYTTFNEGSNSRSQSIIGYFWGTVETKVKNSYLTLPIHATYAFNSPLTVKAGAFVSLLLENNFSGKARNGYVRDQTPVGLKEEIDEAYYDFSKEVRPVNAGVEIGADYRLNSRLFASAMFNYALTPLMKKDFQSIDFDLHNLYLNLGVGYRF